jgi:plastocyanin
VGTPPCGQKAPVAHRRLAPEIALADVTEIDMGDNFFAVGDAHNPTFTMSAGESFTIPIKNSGAAIHNMATAGPDGELNTDDDLISDPDTISGGGDGEITITYATAGTYKYQCQFHPVDMVGEIIVQ